MNMHFWYTSNNVLVFGFPDLNNEKKSLLSSNLLLVLGLSSLFDLLQLCNAPAL